jgi:endonuclease YncB( thermonuclease family)
LNKLISNKKIECIINDIDRYNRYVAICTADEININQWMVRNGWAIAYRYYSKDYILDEKYAQDNELGIWKGEFVEPYRFRRQNKN